MISVDDFAASLRALGWNADVEPKPRELPADIRTRYFWLPRNVHDFVCRVSVAVAPDQKSWFVTAAEMQNNSSAFRWDQWERDSLDAAKSNESWQSQIKEFWDHHFPIVLSVRHGYAYVAIRIDSKIVGGNAPEYEDTEVICDTFAEFIANVQKDTECRYC